MKSLRKNSDTMLELGSNDPRLVVMVGDISHGILSPFAKACLIAITTLEYVNQLS